MGRDDHGQVACEGDWVDEQEGCKEDALEPRLLCEPQQEEPGDMGAVLPCGAPVTAETPSKTCLYPRGRPWGQCLKLF